MVDSRFAIHRPCRRLLRATSINAGRKVLQTAWHPRRRSEICQWEDSACRDARAPRRCAEVSRGCSVPRLRSAEEGSLHCSLVRRTGPCSAGVRQAGRRRIRWGFSRGAVYGALRRWIGGNRLSEVAQRDRRDTHWRVGPEPGRVAGAFGSFAISGGGVRNRGVRSRSLSRRTDDRLLRERVKRPGHVRERRSRSQRGAPRHLELHVDRARAQQDDSFGVLPTPDQLGKPVGRSLIWFRHEAIYDPVPALRALRVPALFLFGDKDRLIPVEESVAVIKRVQAEDRYGDFTIRELPNDDHGMYLVSSYGNGAIDPEYLKTMREWLRAHVLKMP